MDTVLKLDLISKHSKLDRENDVIDGKLYSLERDAKNIKLEIDLLYDQLIEKRESYRYLLSERNGNRSLMNKINDSLKNISFEKMPDLNINK
jgi:hypothetical protein